MFVGRSKKEGEAGTRQQLWVIWQKAATAKSDYYNFLVGGGVLLQNKRGKGCKCHPQFCTAGLSFRYRSFTHFTISVIVKGLPWVLPQNSFVLQKLALNLFIFIKVTFHNYLNCQNKERKSLESVSNFCCLNFHNIYIFLPLVSSGSLSSFFWDDKVTL